MSQEVDTSGGLRLSPVIVEAIARRVAELLRVDLAEPARLLTPSQVAERFVVSRTWVYEHATELGAVRLGQGPKARLRFDPKTVSQVLHRDEQRSPDRFDDDGRSGETRPDAGSLLPIYGVPEGQ